MRKGFHRKQAWKLFLSLFLSILNRQERPLCVSDVLPLSEKAFSADIQIILKQLLKKNLFSGLHIAFHELHKTKGNAVSQSTDCLPHRGACFAFAVSCVNNDHSSPSKLYSFSFVCRVLREIPRCFAVSDLLSLFSFNVFKIKAFSISSSVVIFSNSFFCLW